MVQVNIATPGTGEPVTAVELDLSEYTPPAIAPPSATGLGISGTQTVGNTLTGTYTYNPGSHGPEGSTRFAWYRNGQLVPGQTTVTYNLTIEDEGSVMTFVVVPVSASGVIGLPATATTGLIQPAVGSAPVASGVEITGVFIAGQTLTGSYSYSDADGDLEGGSTFRWLRSTVATGITTKEYLLTDTDVGETITFEVTPVAATGSPAAGTPVVSSGTPTILAQPGGPPLASSVAVNGTVQEGEVLTPDYDYSDPDNDPEGLSEYRWLRDGAAIAGASGTTNQDDVTTDAAYTIVNADVGSFLIFEILPVSTAFPSRGGAVQSGALGPVLPLAAPLPSVNTIVITGTETVGQVLTGTYVFVDPNSAGDSSTFRWARVSPSDPSIEDDIPGATLVTYALQTEDAGQAVKFYVTPVDGQGNVGVAGSDSTGTIAALSASVPTAENVVISGDETVGSTLEANYDYSDPESDPEGNSTYRWLRDGLAITGASGTTQATGTPASSYTLTIDDEGALIGWEITPVSTIAPTTGPPQTAYTTAVIAPLPGSAPVVTNVTVSPSSPVFVGNTVSGGFDPITDPDGDEIGPPLLRWLRRDTGGNVSVIAGQTTGAYVVQPGDEGYVLIFEVTPVALTGTPTHGTPVQAETDSVQALVASDPTPLSVEFVCALGTLSVNQSHTEASPATLAGGDLKGWIYPGWGFCIFYDKTNTIGNTSYITWSRLTATYVAGSGPQGEVEWLEFFNLISSTGGVDTYEMVPRTSPVFGQNLYENWLRGEEIMYFPSRELEIDPARLATVAAWLEKELFMDMFRGPSWQSRSMRHMLSILDADPTYQDPTNLGNPAAPGTLPHARPLSVRWGMQEAHYPTLGYSARPLKGWRHGAYIPWEAQADANQHYDPSRIVAMLVVLNAEQGNLGKARDNLRWGHFLIHVRSAQGFAHSRTRDAWGYETAPAPHRLRGSDGSHFPAMKFRTEKDNYVCLFLWEALTGDPFLTYTCEKAKDTLLNSSRNDYVNWTGYAGARIPAYVIRGLRWCYELYSADSALLTKATSYIDNVMSIRDDNDLWPNRYGVNAPSDVWMMTKLLQAIWDFQQHGVATAHSAAVLDGMSFISTHGFRTQNSAVDGLDYRFVYKFFPVSAPNSSGTGYGNNPYGPLSQQGNTMSPHNIAWGLSVEYTLHEHVTSKTTELQAWERCGIRRWAELRSSVISGSNGTAFGIEWPDIRIGQQGGAWMKGVFATHWLAHHPWNTPWPGWLEPTNPTPVPA